MKYPKKLEKNDIIGVTAPSKGITKPKKISAYESAKKHFKERGYTLTETANLKTNHKGVSASKEIRAKNFMSLITNKDVKAIFSLTGGDFLIEILPVLDFKVISNNIKWVQGYSDMTALLFIITTDLDIATIYGNNFTGWGTTIWHESLINNLRILEGKNIIQNSFARFEKNREHIIEDTEYYSLDSSMRWKIISDNKETSIKGRLIGGCLDSLLNLVGTRFDKVKRFNRKYKKEGVIWYFDIFDLSSEEIIRGLWQLKNAGWFDYAQGFIFGRMKKHSTYNNIPFDEAIQRSLRDCKKPLISNADFGHTNPKMTLINGALTTITCKDGKGSIMFEIKR